MKKLLIYLKDYKKESVFGPLFKLLEASFELFVPLVVAAMIDTGIGGENRPYLFRMCLLLVALALIGLVCAVTAQYFAAKASVGFACKLRRALFAHMQTLAFPEIDALGTSTMITRMTSDVNQVQNGVNLFLRLLLRSPFVVFGAMIMAFFVDAKTALWFVVAIPLLSVVIFGIMLVSIPLYQKVQRQLDRVLTITRGNLTGVRVIRAFCKESEEVQEFSEENQALSAMQRLVGKISALLNPLTYVLINFAVIALIYTGALRVNAGRLTQGEVIALYNYMSQILVELIKLANLIISITKAAASANRIAAVLEVTPSIAGIGAQIADSQTKSSTDSMSAMDTPDVINGQNTRTSTPAVEFRNVSFAYPGAGAESLSQINFSVPRGAMVGVIGGTGSGKTTLAHLIPRFYEATDGEVCVDGVNVSTLPLTELRAKIAVVLQKAVLFGGTIRENLLWGKQDASDEALYAALEQAQAKEIVDKKEGGLSYEIAQGGKNLSGGQRQRLTIARALVKQPDILILDDSSSALDYATDAALRQALKTLPYHPTVFVISQRTASIRHADLILVLEDGRLVGKGTHEELLASCDIYREIHQSQFQEEGGAAS